MRVRADQLEEIGAEAEQSEEARRLADLKAALEMHERVMRAMMAEIQAGIARKCRYKFSVVRDENKLITEIVATPVEGANG